MVTLLITALVLVLIGIGLYYWQKPAADYSEHVLPPNPQARGLFADSAAAAAAAEEAKQLAIAAARQSEMLISRARGGDHSVLEEAHQLGDQILYDRVLSELVQTANSGSELTALMSEITQNQLPVNVSLAQAAIASWRQSPDPGGTARALHFAALTNDADVYQTAVEAALAFWREHKLSMPARDLQALFDAEFWILSSGSRSSGAGFVLKRTLENARRELEATTRVKQ